MVHVHGRLGITKADIRVCTFTGHRITIIMHRIIIIPDSVGFGFWLLSSVGIEAVDVTKSTAAVILNTRSMAIIIALGTLTA